MILEHFYNGLAVSAFVIFCKEVTFDIAFTKRIVTEPEAHRSICQRKVPRVPPSRECPINNFSKITIASLTAVRCLVERTADKALGIKVPFALIHLILYPVVLLHHIQCLIENAFVLQMIYPSQPFGMKMRVLFIHIIVDGLVITSKTGGSAKEVGIDIFCRFDNRIAYLFISLRQQRFEHIWKSARRSFNPFTEKPIIHEFFFGIRENAIKNNDFCYESLEYFSK
mmetsp:Transcript_917/g.2635  ORF Transcript_917/g.2635 Transcript_917/m.2635 type:complete len:226 (-) Transcript_917:880-1557(-)